MEPISYTPKFRVGSPSVLSLLGLLTRGPQRYTELSLSNVVVLGYLASARVSAAASNAPAAASCPLLSVPRKADARISLMVDGSCVLSHLQKQTRHRYAPFVRTCSAGECSLTGEVGGGISFATGFDAVTRRWVDCVRGGAALPLYLRCPWFCYLPAMNWLRLYKSDQSFLRFCGSSFPHAVTVATQHVEERANKPQSQPSSPI